MVSNDFDLSTLEQILDKTLGAIEKSQKEIFDVAEMARTEYLRVQKELETVKKKVGDSIKSVEDLELQSKGSRLRLMEVSREFNKYSEEEVKEAYEYAQDFQIRLILSREWERQLRAKRDELERSLKNLEFTITKAENLIHQVALAMTYLRGSMEELSHKIESLQQRQQVGVQIIKVQEEERKRVAREIHDGPAQSLANVVFRLEVCERLMETDLDKAKRELKEMKEQVRSGLQDVRRIIFDLRPMVLDDLGLIPALRRYLVDYQEKFGIETHFAFFGQEERLKSHLEVAIFRIVQEGLTNIRKHAEASQATVRMEMKSPYVTVVVEDNGRGFEVEKMLASSSERLSYGLISMKERAELFGGTVSFSSQFGRGSKIISRFNVSG